VKSPAPSSEITDCIRKGGGGGVSNLSFDVRIMGFSGMGFYLQRRPTAKTVELVPKRTLVEDRILARQILSARLRLSQTRLCRPVYTLLITTTSHGFSTGFPLRDL
jgi:hypothetical protein